MIVIEFSDHLGKGGTPRARRDTKRYGMREQSGTEFAERRAGVGYSAVVMEPFSYCGLDGQALRSAPER